MPTDRRTVTKRDRIIESFLAGGLVRCLRALAYPWFRL